MTYDINQERAPNQADAEPLGEAMIREARALGYTREIYVDDGNVTLNVLVKPDADLDGSFKAYCMGEYEYVRVNGRQALTIEEA